MCITHQARIQGGWGPPPPHPQKWVLHVTLQPHCSIGRYSGCGGGGIFPPPQPPLIPAVPPPPQPPLIPAVPPPPPTTPYSGCAPPPRPPRLGPPLRTAHVK